MTDTTDDPALIAKAMRSELNQLIEALDRRVPRLERLGEAAIARDAADLRERALRLIRQIDGTIRSE
jgi:hypothetical protein